MSSQAHPISLSSLPRDALDHTMDFLTGWDLLALGCTNKAMASEINRDQSVWQKRLPAEHTDMDETAAALSTPLTWKQKYSAAQSLRLSGGDCDEAIPLPKDTAAKWQSNSFSIDMWFCMLPRSSSDTNSFTGGILLGAQSPATSEKDHNESKNSRPEYHQQLIHVDPLGNLYCSVTKNKPIVNAKLQLERWYHVALTYRSGLQCVYLDGALLHVIKEPLHVEWGKMKHLQFGSGFMTFGSKGRPTDTFVGWYGFHGLLDSHRVWDRALSMGDVQRLARGSGIAQAALPLELPQKDNEHQTTPNLVRCTRPLERYCTSIASI